MEQSGAHHEPHHAGTDMKGLWAVLLIIFGPSALTLWWVIHQAG